ncbi:YqzE family protein [Paenibacillus lignilyticus]|uniref:YqzE family protein n=1 Tax=Paenibacillus lignilyticus TaxID=1172615 RepID=A0ABS5C5G1_9BACL|nr:YqzE family protein [Paenibacillus lignilyticus]MBP3961232.1 YqzE family protein [Paenibacillus lignilyticus]
MAVEKPEEYIKFMTGKMIEIIDTPQEARKERRKQAKAAREPWLTRWFGMGGLGVMQLIRSKPREEG